MNRIPVMIDCDPGHDDAIALIMALASDKLDVRCITTVAGNNTLENTTKNCLKVLTVLGKEHDVPVAMGLDHPMFKPLRISKSVHGESGMDGPVVPDPVVKPVDMNAVQLMEKVVRESEERVTIVPIGPLTNVGTFLLANPDLKPKIERICLMGGSSLIGNSGSATAEFNIFQDAEAANVVFSSGIPIVMHDIESTRKAFVEEKDIEELRGMNHVGKFVAELMDFFTLYSKQHNLTFSIHDACAVSWLIDPSIFISTFANVTVDIVGEKTYGCTVTDFRANSTLPKNTEVVLNVHRERFVQLLKDCVKQYSK